jgi:hypothetical protein
VRGDKGGNLRQTPGRFKKAAKDQPCNYRRARLGEKAYAKSTANLFLSDVRTVSIHA